MQVQVSCTLLTGQGLSAGVLECLSARWRSAIQRPGGGRGVTDQCPIEWSPAHLRMFCSSVEDVMLRPRSGEAGR